MNERHAVLLQILRLGKLSIRRSTVSKIVRLMESKELIEREASASDARPMLTDKARRIHKVASAEYTAFEAHAAEALSNEEIETLSALLERISSSLTTENKEDKI